MQILNTNVDHQVLVIIFWSPSSTELLSVVTLKIMRGIYFEVIEETHRGIRATITSSNLH